MRNSSECPKCQSSDIVQIRQPGPYANNIVTGMTLFSLANITRYLCAACGFTEEWVESADDIARIKKKYAS